MSEEKRKNKPGRLKETKLRTMAEFLCVRAFFRVVADSLADFFILTLIKNVDLTCVYFNNAESKEFD